MRIRPVNEFEKAGIRVHLEHEVIDVIRRNTALRSAACRPENAVVTSMTR